MISVSDEILTNQEIPIGGENLILPPLWKRGGAPQRGNSIDSYVGNIHYCPRIMFCLALLTPPLLGDYGLFTEFISIVNGGVHRHTRFV